MCDEFILGLTDEEPCFANRFILRKLALSVFPVYNRLLFGLTVSGEENLRSIEGGMVTVCNHVHTLDCTMVASVCKEHLLYFPTLDENLKMPFIGRLVDDLGGIPIPGRLSDFRSFLNGIEWTLRQGNAVHLFPEGSLEPYCETLRPFEKGAFTFAYDAGVPLVPMVLSYRETSGIRKILRKKPLLHLEVLEPLYPRKENGRNKEVQRLLKNCRSRMQETLAQK